MQEEFWQEEVVLPKPLDVKRLVPYKRTYVVTEAPGRLIVEEEVETEFVVPEKK